MAPGGIDDFSSDITETQPTGPLFADDGQCRCALQEALNTEAWRCIANATSNIYTGQTGKWFLAANQTNPKSLQEPANSGNNPPDIGTSYIIEGEGQDAKFVVVTPQNQGMDLGDITCSGKNDTRASSALYRFLAAATIDSLSPCWQPGITPLLLQNASDWNATGCNLGFLCECISPNI